MSRVVTDPDGQVMTLRAGLEGAHGGRRGGCRARIVTEGGEQARIRHQRRFNGKFFQKSGFAVLLTRCPACGHDTEIDTRIWLPTATLAAFAGFRQAAR